MAHHEFAPEVYHTAIGSHEPVLEIADGDAVSTTTVDARGGDSNGEAVTARGNPQTGPFFIEGAEPGDTLAVTFDRLTPNRKTGFTGGSIASNVLDFGYVPRFEEKVEKIEWEINLERGVARPLGVSSPLSDLRLPLRPMLGCFGVAPPARQAISAGPQTRPQTTTPTAARTQARTMMMTTTALPTTSTPARQASSTGSRTG